MGDLVWVTIFFPKPLDIEFFFPIILPVYDFFPCVIGHQRQLFSVQDIFSLGISMQDFFSEITLSPPSKVKWSAP